jgi:glycosyltransferase involved in cell wall biosynthesis
MSRVLVIAYHFPPVGGAGVQRSVRFVEHLPDFGWEPVVVTAPGPSGDRWSPLDESLAAQLPEGLEVIRLREPEPAASDRLRRRGERWLRIPPAFASWWIDGVVAAATAAGPVDAVYASMSPFESGDAAAAVSRLIGRPWIADLRDPWALDEMQVFPTALHRRLELHRMGRLLAGAGAVVMNTREATTAVLSAFPELRGRHVATIPNGYDARDFATPEPRRSDRAFRVVHTGYLHTDLGRQQRRRGRARRLLGGAISNVDILTRSHLYLLEALRDIRARRPDLAPRLELHLAGVVSDADREALRGDDWITVHDYLPHEDSVALVRGADLLFLPMHDLPEGRRARIVPGKTYEYLASGRPILAAVPDGDARDLLSTRPSAVLCRPADAAAMARAVEQMMDATDAGGRTPSEPLGRLHRRYERRELTRTLASLLDAATGATRAEPDVAATASSAR